MTREDPQLKVRLPEALKAEIEVAAKSNNRSMNAEIVSRLQSPKGSSANDTDIILSQALRIASLEYEIFFRETEAGTLKLRLAEAAQYLLAVGTDDPSMIELIEDFADYQSTGSLEDLKSEMIGKLTAMQTALDRLDEVRPDPNKEELHDLQNLADKVRKSELVAKRSVDRRKAEKSSGNRIARPASKKPTAEPSDG